MDGLLNTHLFVCFFKLILIVLFKQFESDGTLFTVATARQKNQVLDTLGPCAGVLQANNLHELNYL